MDTNAPRWVRVGAAATRQVQHDVSMSMSKHRRRRPASAEGSAQRLMAIVPMWAWLEFKAVADRLQLSYSTTAALCVVEEMTRLQAKLGWMQVPVPEYLREGLPRLEGAEEPLLDEEAFWTSPAQNDPYRIYLYLPEAQRDPFLALAAHLGLKRSHLGGWLLFHGANRLRTAVGLPTTPVPGDLEFLMRRALAQAPAVEGARLVS